MTTCDHSNRVMVRDVHTHATALICRACGRSRPNRRGYAWHYRGHTQVWVHVLMGDAHRLCLVKGRRRSLPTHPARWLGAEEGWYYGYGGFEGEPDAEGPRYFRTRKEAGVIECNYELAGPFDTKALAEAHLEAWFKSVEGES